MSRLTKRNFLIALAVLVISVAIFTYMLAVSERQSSQLRDQLVTLEKQRIQEASYLKMRRTIEDNAADVATLDGMFLKRESDSIDFLNLVESEAATYDVALETVSLLSEETDDGQALVVRYAIAGSGDNVRNFIALLEQLQYVAEITSVELSTENNNDWRAEVTVQVNIYEYAE